MVLCDGLITVDELPEVKPKLNFQTQQDVSSNEHENKETIITKSVQQRYGNRYQNPPMSSFGGDKAHNNVPPSKAVYMWTRTA